MSESSSCSVKEIRIWKPGGPNNIDEDNQVKGGYSSGGHGRGYGVEERLVFVAGEGKSPFSICSIIRSQKASSTNPKTSAFR